MATIPTSYNPSDYEYLLKSLTEGNLIAKCQSLKRFNTLVVNDKKQFSSYAKRVVLAIQDLMYEAKEEINLLALMLTLEIINLNPKEIQYYLRTKLLKHIVINLGDTKPQIRKTSHYCVLAYVKTFKSFDDICHVYMEMGINSHEPQLRQKCINSFQSILISEIKHLNWNSSEFRKYFELLLQKLRDENPYVQKATEQCLITISKFDQIKAFSKKLPPPSYALYKIFYDSQIQLGHLTDAKMESHQKINKNPIPNPTEINRNKSNSTHSMVSLEKISLIRQDTLSKKAIIDRIQEIRKYAQTPKIQDEPIKVLKKTESVQQVPLKEQRSVIIKKQNQHSLDEKMSTPKRIYQKEKELISPPLIHPVVYSTKTEKIENILGKKLLEDLKNEKDWKVRLEAIEELQTKFEIYKEAFQIESLMKSFVPVLVKLLTDQNFKIALISLKIVQQLLQMPAIKKQQIIPQIVQKITDNKIALRQNVSKLIRKQYLSTKEQIWMDQVLEQLKKSPSNNTKQQILNILSKLYQQNEIKYSYEKVIEAIHPLMDDLKTKIKIRTLDLLVLITVKTLKVDSIKHILMGKMNQVYYEMYLEKMNKEMKNHRAHHQDPDKDDHSKQPRHLAFPSLKTSKNSPNNTTSTSLQKYSRTTDTKPLSKANSFIQKSPEFPKEFHIPKSQRIETFSTKNLHELDDTEELRQNDRVTSQSFRRMPIVKSYRKKIQRTFQSKLITNYSQTENLKPFNDPEKEMKNILIEIKSEDWQVAYDSLTKLRRMICHHQQEISVATSKLFLPDLLKHVESLRSSLSKNAVITLNDLTNLIKRGLDSDVDQIFNKLIKKTLDANSFISEEVKKALVSICSNCNENKIVTLLISSHTSRAIPIKQTVIYLLENIVFLPKVYQKELERIMQILVDFTHEGSLEIRQKTKNLLNIIIEKEKANSRLLRIVPAQYLQKFKRKQSVQQQKQEKVFEEVVIEKKQIEEIPLKKKKKTKILVFPSQFNNLEDLLQKCQNSDWKIRLQSMSQIFKICCVYPEETSQHRLSSKVVDILSKQINDPNTKVGSNALNIFKEVSKLIPLLIENNLSVILNEIFNCFGSQKAEIRLLSEELFDNIANNIDKWMMLQHICTGVLYGIPKTKLIILNKLIQIVPPCYKAKPTIFQKNVYPMINKLAEENKPDIISILRQLIQTCIQYGGEDVYSFLKQTAKNIVSQ